MKIIASLYQDIIWINIRIYLNSSNNTGEMGKCPSDQVCIWWDLVARQSICCFWDLSVAPSNMVLGDVLQRLFGGQPRGKVVRRHTFSTADGGKENRPPCKKTSKAKRRILDDFITGRVCKKWNSTMHQHRRMTVFSILLNEGNSSEVWQCCFW